MSVMSEDEFPACADCLKHDGGWSAWCDECHVLAREELAKIRARLVEIEAERDEALNDCHHVPALAEAEAHMAEVEAERDAWVEQARAYGMAGVAAENAHLRARLAEVAALCEWADDNVPSHIRLIDYCRFVLRVRAAARGEGDQ